MQNVEIQQNKGTRKKKNRHILDASLASESSNGFAQSQFHSQGTFVPSGQSTNSGATNPHQFHQYNQHNLGSDEPNQPIQPPRVEMEPGHFPGVAEDAREAMDFYRHNLFYTGQTNGVNPPANIDFSAIDTGVSNPKFARLSMGLIPSLEEVLTASHLPLSLTLQPLADLTPEEGTVPVVDYTQSSIPRCHRCRTYINPAMLFLNGGAKYSCNICGFANETPAEYYSPSDSTGRRQDWSERPELQYGTCDFIVGKDYWAREKAPRPIHILFAIDVSEQALIRGVPKAATDAILRVLYGQEEQKLPEGARIALVTFDRACHFYSLDPALTTNPQMMSISDVEDMFVPMEAGLFACPRASRSIIEATLVKISTMFEKDAVPEPALGALSRAAWLALNKVGGKLCLFLSALPTWGPGRLKVRENPSLYNTPDERALYDAASPHWKNIAEEFVNIGVGVDCFFFPSAYIDIATISLLSQTTGGDTFYYQNFVAERDAPRFSEELQRSIYRSQGSAVQMKLRCSNGLRVVSIIGGLLQKGPSDLEMGSVDADKAVTFVLKHDGKLDAKSEVHFQSAVLFTTPDGHRVLRTHNTRCAVARTVGEVLRSCDSGAAIATIAKVATSQVLKTDLKVVKQTITDQCVRVLAAYRKNCATNLPAGELILPESLKLFPLLTLAVQKQFAFRTDSINSDVRVNNQRLIRRCSVRDLLSLIYPRLIPIHSLAPDDGFADDSGHLKLPTVSRNSFKQLDNGGAYILDNGQTLYLWFKSDVTPALLQDLYGEQFTSLEALNPRSTQLPVLETLLNTQVRNIIAYLNTFSTSRHLVPQISRQTLDGSEMTFAQGLVDDRNCDNLAYADFLIYVHKHVQVLLAETQQSRGIGSWISGHEQAY
ncbi:protein of unknown function [Taphrina deformans PYCC 5710]|uniref:Uncharacterized protein n=1 Tax=Taphrina deformans (strain PYCC 5710 / ATCC 11124 / CBS 356.35 / IMI 108563 / JCM 9778 / NBRC 8474) TaxID=1097556 RepID=R4XDR5_TAPDE|nr:protein of unknown function [Taphrina deformans PYCC 5710]|eukprot:CCG83767.1 protein of unknown function [Taphrina deformans PYCC 5710]